MAELTERIYEPRETRNWSTHELDALIGRHVETQINGSERSGVVTVAGISRFGSPFLAFDDGSSVGWDRHSDEATIAVGPEVSR